MADRGKKKILIVDDNPAFGQMIEMGLSEEFEIVRAFDGEEGLTMALAEKPDLILMDVMMPKVSGIEMLRNLLSDPDTRVIPVLVLTASQFDPSTRTLFEQESNVRGFLQKPCGLDMLHQRISVALEQ